MTSNSPKCMFHIRIILVVSESEMFFLPGIQFIEIFLKVIKNLLIMSIFFRTSICLPRHKSRHKTRFYVKKWKTGTCGLIFKIYNCCHAWIAKEVRTDVFERKEIIWGALSMIYYIYETYLCFCRSTSNWTKWFFPHLTSHCYILYIFSTILLNHFDSYYYYFL